MLCVREVAGGWEASLRVYVSPSCTFEWIPQISSFPPTLSAKVTPVRLAANWPFIRNISNYTPIRCVCIAYLEKPQTAGCSAPPFPDFTDLISSPPNDPPLSRMTLGFFFFLTFKIFLARELAFASCFFCLFLLEGHTWQGPGSTPSLVLGGCSWWWSWSVGGWNQDLWHAKHVFQPVGKLSGHQQLLYNAAVNRESKIWVLALQLTYSVVMWP